VTQATLTATDPSGNSGSCRGSVTVVDTTPPTISAAGASPAVLWPPNHKMVPVVVSAAVSDACDASAASRCAINSVTSNEGMSPGDAQVTGNLTLSLRAERSGGAKSRVYTIGVRCADASGNASTRAVSVTVPHDAGN
jgi:hypothetical protein